VCHPTDREGRRHERQLADHEQRADADIADTAVAQPFRPVATKAPAAKK